ncbi:unnamed protein product [Medioppia subpectinata]|uniref:ABC transporter domain-containing protein n=1 Tax=Medioppia subpectinata TaxID=1979941 RepID=A0A7R9KDR6_9ACAR|nr:unnamed protein product [Medioppia subpectinata]CAG2101407.1 unnamed protein product [Medioppia subpectinata]
MINNHHTDEIPFPIAISWHDINVFSKKSRGIPLPFRKGDHKPSAHILINVSGQTKSGQLLAIMGSSGAGKTTLINVLTRRNLSEMVVKGSVKLNGKSVDQNCMKSVSAYVQQKDLFMGNLTVREHMRFQSRVRMDQSIANESRVRRVEQLLQEKDLFMGNLTVREHMRFQSRVRMDQSIANESRVRRVEQLLQELGLVKCANTKIGAPDGETGISGGEKKRLAVASELLTNPSILFLDEPTSGLDSFMAYNIVEVLRDMAQTGRTIICTIHQPSSEVFSLFNQLLLMADGRVAYLGTSENAIEYFSSLGLNCPNNYNPSDFYIKQLAVIPGNEVESREKLNSICDRFLVSIYAKIALPDTTTHYCNNDCIEYDNYECIQTNAKYVYKVNWFIQFWALLWRATLSAMREPMLTTVRLMQTLILSVVFGSIYWQLDKNQAGIMSTNGAIFTIICTITLQNIFGVVTTFCLEMPIFLREHNNGTYGVSAYFLSKILAELPSFIMNPVLYVCIVYWMIGLNSEVNVFLTCVGICFNKMIKLSQFIKINHHCLLQYSQILVWIGWIKYISWFYYGNEALIINQWRGIDHIDCEYEVVNGTVLRPCTPNGAVVIQMLNFDEDHFYRNIYLLITISFVVRILAGAGKTTLLNVLTMLNSSNMTVNGEVRLNGKIVDQKRMKSVSAYVQQNDLFIGKLTVREHMDFEARVRMDRSTTKEARDCRVNQVLLDLSLVKCANTRIASISGGERKRLAVASELLSDPSILFLDEPTSGLDSFMARNLVEILLGMKVGRIIILTIHQPSSDVFSLFDQLLLMADKRGICDRFLVSNYAKMALPDTSTNYNQNTNDDNNHIQTIDKFVYKVNWCIQFKALIWRAWLSALREPMLTYFRFLQTIFLLFVFGSIYWQLDMDQAGSMSINGAIFTIICSITLQNVFGVVTTFCIEMPIFLREHNNGLYRVSAYFVSKILAEFYISVYSIGWLASTVIKSYFSSYMVSSISNSVIMALTIATMLILPLMILGGFFINTDEIQVWIAWVRYISWFYYGNEALIINQWRDIQHIGCEYDVVDGTPVRLCIPNGTVIIEMLHFQEDHFGLDIWLLFVISMVLVFCEI